MMTMLRDLFLPDGARHRLARSRWLPRALVAAAVMTLLVLAPGPGRWQPDAWAGDAAPTATPAPAGTVGPISPRIVGGSPVPTGTYRFMAYLIIGNARACGGSLIDATHVLTAAHCLYGMTSGTEVKVYLGGTTRPPSSAWQTEGGIFRSSTTWAIHPQYDDPTTRNDAAVITLGTPIPPAASGGIDPIAFVPSGSSLGLTPSQLLTVAGWGTTSFQGSASSVLLEVDVPVQSDAYCKQQYGLGNSDIAVMFCAGPQEGGKDSCQGDSGGPIFFDNAGALTQVGIVSWGSGCADAGYPGVYARVAASSINGFITGFVPAPTPTPTATATATADATATPTATATSTATATATPTSTATPTTTAPPKDTTPPAVSIASPKSGQTVGSPVTVKVNASDAGSGVASVQLLRCAGTTCKPISTDSAAPYAFKVTLKPGSYDIVALAVDRAGNSAKSRHVKFTVGKSGRKSAARPPDPSSGTETARGRDDARDTSTRRPDRDHDRKQDRDSSDRRGPRRSGDRDPQGWTAPAGVGIAP